MVCSSAYLSDHSPMSVSLDCQLAVSSSVGSCPTKIKRVAWHKAITNQIEAYQSRVRETSLSYWTMF